MKRARVESLFTITCPHEQPIGFDSVYLRWYCWIYTHTHNLSKLDRWKKSTTFSAMRKWSRWMVVPSIDRASENLPTRDGEAVVVVAVDEANERKRERERNRKKECLLTYLLAYLASLNHRPFLRFYLAKNKRCSFWPNLHKLTGEQVLLDGAGFRWFSHRQQQWTGQWNAAMAVLAGLHTSLWLLFPSSKLSDWEGER